jgi:hypothetical protein
MNLRYCFFIKYRCYFTLQFYFKTRIIFAINPMIISDYFNEFIYFHLIVEFLIHFNSCCLINANLVFYLILNDWQPNSIIIVINYLIIISYQLQHLCTFALDFDFE